MQLLEPERHRYYGSADNPDRTGYHINLPDSRRTRRQPTDSDRCAYELERQRCLQRHRDQQPRATARDGERAPRSSRWRTGSLHRGKSHRPEWNAIKRTISGVCPGNLGRKPVSIQSGSSFAGSETHAHPVKTHERNRREREHDDQQCHFLHCSHRLRWAAFDRAWPGESRNRSTGRPRAP